MVVVGYARLARKRSHQFSAQGIAEGVEWIIGTARERAKEG